MSAIDRIRRLMRPSSVQGKPERAGILRRLLVVERQLDALEKPTPKFVDDYAQQDRLRRPV